MRRRSRNTPAEIVEKLNKERNGTADPEVANCRFGGANAHAFTEFGKFITDETERGRCNWFSGAKP
jgi:hypothetical protein